jgi:predicted ATPase/DNA-binding winged helix-turn-helix (wHTH) protein
LQVLPPNGVATAPVVAPHINLNKTENPESVSVNVAERIRQLVFEYGPWTVDLARRELLAKQISIPLGGRAFEIIEVLVQSAGELVLKEELMDRIWPGAVITENTLQVHISAVRKAFGKDRGLLKTVSGRGYRLLGSWSGRDAAQEVDLRGVMMKPSAERPFQNNLPLAVSKLIGRAADVSTLRNLLSAYRVVSLIGPGGIGKTSLALEVARSVLPDFQGEAGFVELASLWDPNLVCSTAAGVLGLKLPGNTISPASIAQAIGERKLLLVVDNCEHVIDIAARLVETVVRMCPRVCVIATSREALRIDSEICFRVKPLDLPPRDSPASYDMLQHGAIELFNTRVQALQFGLSLQEKDISAIAAICRRLDGIPLAIEFAAACASTLGLDQILSGLEDRFGLLTRGGRRTALPRHQTLRATLDWSYELLPESERKILRLLSIFPGSFTLEAATAVVGDANSAGATAQGIANLVEKSLVAPDGTATSGGWRLLETTRVYALQKLGESGEAEHAAQRHATFFCNFVTEAVPNSPLQPIESMRRYSSEIDNVRAALDWAFSPAGDGTLGITLTSAFVPVWLHLSLLIECRERVSQALVHLEVQATPEPHLGMRLHIALGLSLVYTTGLVTRTQEVLAKGLQLAQDLNDLDNQLVALWALWFYHMSSGELRRAEPLAAQFVAAGVQSGDQANLLLGEQIIGGTMHYKGNQLDARRHFERALAFPDPLNDLRHSTWIVSDVRTPAPAMMARVLLLQGLIDQAADSARLSFEDEVARGRPLSTCTVLRYAVCAIAFAIDDLATADWSVAMVTDLAERHGLAFWARIGRCLEGTLLIKRGAFAAGTAMLRAALLTVRNRPPDLLGVLAEGLAGIGEFSDAVETIDERLGRSAVTAEQWYDAELLRIKGEVLLQWDTVQYGTTAEVCFRDAIDLSRQQGAVFWELRAALGLARLRVRQHKADDAWELLAPVYDRFTEGFDTPDLRSARELLDKLEPSSRC